MSLHPVLATFAWVGLSGMLLFAGNSHSKSCKKNARPYSMTVQALRGKTTTDMVLTVSAASGWTAPSLAKHVHMKSLSGRPRWHRNYRNVALEQGRVQISVPEAARGTAVRTEVNLRTCTCDRTHVVKASTKVLLRPDLKIDAVRAPLQIRTGQTVNVEIEVLELNGELGATFDGTLAENGAILDEVTGATVKPAGTTSLVFAISFEEPGIHQIAATVGNSEPGDYDEANNAAAFQIEVLPAVGAVRYSLSYNDSRSNWTLDRTGVQVSHDGFYGSSESINYAQSMPRPLSWPLQDVAIAIWADGTRRMARQLGDVKPTSASESAGSSVQSAQVYWPEEETWVYVSSYSNTTGSGSSLQVNRYAGDSVTTSKGYHTRWGYLYSWDTTTTQKSGVFIHARESLATNVRVTDAGNQKYGGWGTVPKIEHNYSAPVSWSDATRSGTSESESWYAYGEGTTQPD